MASKLELRGEIRRERRRYLSFLYIGGIFFLATMVTTIILTNLYKDPNRALISKTADDIVFQVTLALSAAAFGSVLVGVMIDQYHRRFSEREEELENFIKQEGVVDVFKSYTDPRMVQHLHSLIANAHSEIMFVGLGLVVLSHNRDLLFAIGERVNTTRGLQVGVFLGSGQNPGVMNRIKEEKTWHQSSNLSYDETWVTRYPNEIKTTLLSAVKPEETGRVRIVSVADCPMLTIAKIDHQFLFFAYGSPNVRGSQSPWIAVDGASTNSALVKFLSKVIRFYDEQYRS